MRNHKKKISGKSPSIWKLNNILPNNPWVQKEIKREITKYFELNENENTTYQDLWDAIKAQRENFIALNAYNRKEERLQISDFSFHLKKPEKEEQMKTRRKGMKIK